jgi:hypothetical protein
MGESIESVAERSLIKLLFALADLESHGLQTRKLLGVREQLVSAIEDLARAAPRFDFDLEVRQAVQKSDARRRYVRRHYA